MPETGSLGVICRRERLGGLAQLPKPRRMNILIIRPETADGEIVQQKLGFHGRWTMNPLPERDGHFTVLFARRLDGDFHILAERGQEFHEPPH